MVIGTAFLVGILQILAIRTFGLVSPRLGILIFLSIILCSNFLIIQGECVQAENFLG